MKRLLICASVVALGASAAVAAPSPAPAARAAAHAKSAKSAVAPADEYFGRLKMSILGIRNTIKDLGFKADVDPTNAKSIMGTCALTEDAVKDWEHKYPKDGWLPGTIFALERLYAKVDSDEARTKAVVAMRWLVHDFPRTRFAQTGKTELAQHLVGVKPVTAPAADAVSSTGAAATGPDATK